MRLGVPGENPSQRLEGGPAGNAAHTSEDLPDGLVAEGYRQVVVSTDLRTEGPQGRTPGCLVQLVQLNEQAAVRPRRHHLLGRQLDPVAQLSSKSSPVMARLVSTLVKFRPSPSLSVVLTRRRINLNSCR